MKIDFVNIFYHTLASATIVNFAFIFLTAYFTPAKAVRITFNDFGEANIELLMLIVLLLLMFRFWIIYFSKLNISEGMNR